MPFGLVRAEEGRSGRRFLSRVPSVFNDAEGTIRHWPEDLGRMLELQPLVLVGLLVIGRPGGGPLGFGHQFRLALLRVDHPLPADRFKLFDKHRLQVQDIGHHQIEKPATQVVLQIMQ